MKLELDAYANLDSPLHRWEPRCKLMGLMGLIFSFSMIQSLKLLPIMLGMTLGLYIMSRLPWSFLAQRLRYPGFFLMGIVAFLPFLAGETVVWQWGAISVRLEGCLAVVLISTRFFCILVVALILFGTAPFLTMIKAMRRLGLPVLLGDMMLLTYRYLTEFGDRLKTMKTAISLRGFDGHHLSWRQMQVLAALMGTLLVRSYEQSERVYQAMRLRGYGQMMEIINTSTSIVRTSIVRSDRIATGGVLMVALGLAIAQWIIDN